MPKWNLEEESIVREHYGRIPVQLIRSRYLPHRTYKSIILKAADMSLISSLRGSSRRVTSPSTLPETDNLRDLWTAVIDLQQASRRLETSVTNTSLTIKTTSPIIVGFLADAHIGAMNCKYSDLEERFQQMSGNPSFYLFSVGDSIDNYLPQPHGNGMFEQLIPPKLQKQLVEDLYMRMKGRWLGVVQGCFLEGTPILLANGIEKPIQDIMVYDCVYSDGESKRVLKKFNNVWNGEMVALNVMGVTNTIHATYNHNFYVRKRDGDGTHPIKIGYPKWVEAHEINKGDYIGFPRIKESVSCEYTNEEMYIFGLWLAEGSYQRNTSINFSFNIDELKYVNTVKTFFENKNIKVYISERPERKSIEVAVRSKETNSLYREMFGEYCHGKRLPAHFLWYNNESLQSLLDGLFNGDAHYRNTGWGDEIIWTTTSKSLASQVRQILFKMGIFVSTSYYERDGKRPYWVETFRVNKKRPHHLVDDDYIWLPVKHLDSYHYNGIVYNMEVEDNHTYEVAGMRVKNCHDNWNYTADQFDWTQYLSSKLQCPNLGFGAAVDLTVDRQWYRIMLKHKYRFNSSINLTHTVKRMREMEGDFDIGCVAHHHQAAIEQSIMGDGIDRIFIRPGSFKGQDRYSSQLGFTDSGAFIPSVVLDNTQRMMTAFLHLDQAVSYMESLQ